MKSGVIRIAREVYDEIIMHSKESYPSECCGVLVGASGGEKSVVRSYRTGNMNTERAGDRYEIDPRDLLRIEREARERGLEVVGIYHSHPDHPSSPSAFDRERGWPEYSYVIVSVHDGRRTEMRSWSFTEEDEPFGEEEIVLT